MDERQQKLDQIFDIVYRSAEAVRQAFGAGMPERLYRDCLAHELERAGAPVQRDVKVPVIYKDLQIDDGFVLSIVVDGLVPVVIWTVENLTTFHDQHMHAVLRVSGLPLGVGINFAAPSIRGGMRRIKNPQPRV